MDRGQPIDELLITAGTESYLQPQAIVVCYYERGCDELANQVLKDFVLGVSQPSVSISVKRGERIAKAEQLRLVEG